MKTTIRATLMILATLTLSVSKAETKIESQFDCSIEHNLKKVFSANVTLAEAPSSALFFRSEEFEMKLSRKTSDSYTLEIYDRIKPSRSYSSGSVSKPGDEIEFALWEREGILEVNCRSL